MSDVDRPWEDDLIEGETVELPPPVEPAEDQPDSLDEDTNDEPAGEPLPPVEPEGDDGDFAEDDDDYYEVPSEEEVSKDEQESAAEEARQ